MNMIDEVILVKTITHDHFIGVLKAEDEDGLRLENPMRLEIMYKETSPNRPDVVVLPWDELSKMNDVYLEKFHVLYYTLPKDDIIEFYNKQVKKKINTDVQPEIDIDRNVISAMLEKMASNTSVH
jgi:hypothetical protein